MVAPSRATCRYPTPRCALLLRPTQAPVTSRERRALISTQHPPLRAALVSLAPLLSMPALQSLSLRQAIYGVDTEALALMTGLTHLSLRLQRRDRLGLGTKLQCAPAAPLPHAFSQYVRCDPRLRTGSCGR